MKTHKNLDVWKISIELVTDVYQTTKSFPKEELYGITNQIRRSAVSSPSNIAEGAGRNSKNEFAHFLSISMGSLSELETQIIIAKNIGYIEINTLNKINLTIDKIRRMIIGLQKSIK